MVLYFCRRWAENLTFAKGGDYKLECTNFARYIFKDFGGKFVELMCADVVGVLFFYGHHKNHDKSLLLFD